MEIVMTKGRQFSKRRAIPLLLVTTWLLSTNLYAENQTDVLRKPVGKGAYELVYSQGDNSLYVATSQSRSLDKGGIVYRLDPQTLNITQIIHNDAKPFGATINPQTGVLYFTNTTSNAVTAIDAKTDEVKGRLVLDDRKRSETVKPLSPREVVVDAATDTVYITGLGEASVVWVVNGKDLTLRYTIKDTGKYGTGLALDSAAKRLYVTNAEGELVTIDTATNKVLTRKKLDADKEHFFLNISLDTATHRAFITDSKQAQVLVVDIRDGNVLHRIDVPESLGVLFNPQRSEVYVTHRQAGEVSVIDAKTYKVLKTIKLPVYPNSLALSPDGQVLYVSVKQASTRDKEATQPDDVVRIDLKS